MTDQFGGVGQHHRIIVACHGQHHGGSGNQLVIQRGGGGLRRKFEGGAIHGLSDPLPGALGVVDGVPEFHGDQRHVGSCGRPHRIHRFDLLNLFLEMSDHQAFDALGVGTREGHGDQSGPVWEKRIFLAVHGAKRQRATDCKQYGDGKNKALLFQHQGSKTMHDVGLSSAGRRRSDRRPVVSARR